MSIATVLQVRLCYGARCRKLEPPELLQERGHVCGLGTRVGDLVSVTHTPCLSRDELGLGK